MKKNTSILLDFILNTVLSEINEDDSYLHRATDKYVTPKRTERLKKRLRSIREPKVRKEQDKYIPLTLLANKIKQRIKLNVGKQNEKPQ